jgi:hypothetical protein
MTKATENGEIEVRKGIKHLSKVQIVEWFKHKESQRRMRDDAVSVLFPDDDSPTHLVTEVNPRRAISKIRLRLMSASIDMNRTESLLDIFDRLEDEVMIALKRQGRWEFMVTKQAINAAEEAKKIE